MKVVLDTNVLVSAALALYAERSGTARWLVYIALGAQRRFETVISDPLVTELRTVLARPEMVDDAFAEDFIDLICSISTYVRIDNIPMGCRDPDDDKVIETAMNANADVIVSDDLDLHDTRARYAIAKTGIGIRNRPIIVQNVRMFVASLHGDPPFSPLMVTSLAA